LRFPENWLQIYSEDSMALFIEWMTRLVQGDMVFWLFSSSAQAVATFIAFLIAGYSVFLSVMDNLEEKDESLIGVHHEIKKSNYRWLTVLCILTGSAITFSLIMLFLKNSNLLGLRNYVIPFVLILNISSIIVGILFVLSLINPLRYQTAARHLLQRNAKSTEMTTRGRFIDQFIELEKQLRKLSSSPQYKELYKADSGRVYGLRGIIENLLRSEIIDRDTYVRLLKIVDFRNMVVHGRIDTVEPLFFAELEKILESIKKYVDGNS
jgi:hypothetical protein